MELELANSEYCGLTFEGVALRTPEFKGVEDVFNLNRTYQEVQPLFFEQEHGLIDSINQQHPELWRLYDNLRLIDWKENDFDFSSCQLEFLALDQSAADVAMLTLAWQWEGDSVAAHNVMPILAKFAPCEPLFVLYQRIGDNESIHGLTYARIQKQAFPDAQAAMDRVLQMKEPFQRLSIVAQVFSKAKKIGGLLELGFLRATDYIVRETLFLFLVALYCLERVQFMSSFSITHSTAENDMLVPIAAAVRKIAQDEYNIHAPTVRYCLTQILQTWGKEVMERSRGKVAALLREVCRAEVEWAKFTFSEGRAMKGTNAARVVQQVHHCATDPMLLLGLTQHEVDFEPIIVNPHPTFETWIDINKSQTAAQETRPTHYANGGITTPTRRIDVSTTPFGNLR